MGGWKSYTKAVLDVQACGQRWLEPSGGSVKRTKGVDSVNHYDDTAESWYL